MLLNEFFGKSIDPVKDTQKSRDDRQINDDLFWYIVDHDKLHKDFFHPMAKKIKKANEDNHVDKEEIIDAFMPMVNKGCKEYYHSKKMKGKLGKIFSKDLRHDTCERLYDHYKEDVIKGEYKLGESIVSANTKQKVEQNIKKNAKPLTKSLFTINEDVDNIFKALINKIITNETVSNNK